MPPRTLIRLAPDHESGYSPTKRRRMANAAPTRRSHLGACRRKISSSPSLSPCLVPVFWPELRERTGNTGSGSGSGSWFVLFSDRLLETARDLAEAHRKADPGTTTVLLLSDPAGQEIRLIEVSANAPWSGDVFPFRFEARPDLGIDFPSVVVLLSPGEWADVEAGRLALPPGWDLRVRQVL
jgi:hypothetical protein